VDTAQVKADVSEGVADMRDEWVIFPPVEEA